jgi:hypothetical protein
LVIKNYLSIMQFFLNNVYIHIIKLIKTMVKKFYKKISRTCSLYKKKKNYLYVNVMINTLIKI